MNKKFENFTEKQKIKMQMLKFKAKCAARDGMKWVVHYDVSCYFLHTCYEQEAVR